jgi:hypothetical protein
MRVHERLYRAAAYLKFAQQPLRLSVDPIIDVLAHHIFGQSVALLDLALELT